MMNISALESEGSLSKVSAQDFTARLYLTAKFLSLPGTVFSKLRHFQPQVGCLNRCTFCSQNAGTKIWQFTQSGLKNIIAAMKFAALSKSFDGDIQEPLPLSDGVFKKSFLMPKYGLITNGRHYKPGTVYAYLDNDPSLYPYLDNFLDMLWTDLGVKTRITTVGFSRKNPDLNNAHKRISNDLSDAISKFVLSYTPYTFGWTKSGEMTGQTSRREFSRDLKNVLELYKPNAAKGLFSIEFKFRPLVRTVDIIEFYVGGHHLVHAGPYLLVSENTNPSLKTAKLREINGHSVILDKSPEPYLMLVSDRFAGLKGIDIFYELFNSSDRALTLPESEISKKVELYTMENEDGKYYTIDPKITEDGFFGKQFYLKTDKREKSGYIDSERYFLNSLISQKRERDHSRGDSFHDALWSDVDSVTQKIRRYVEYAKTFNNTAANYISDEVLPLVETYIDCLKESNYSPSYFFDKNFTVDTGTICNLGRAFYEFKGLVSRPNVPLTPQQERAYGTVSSLSQDKKVWRISPVPLIKTESGVRTNLIGKYNSSSQKELMSVQQIDLSKRTSSNLGLYIVKQIYIDLPPKSIEVVNNCNKIPNIPGSVSQITSFTTNEIIN